MKAKSKTPKQSKVAIHFGVDERSVRRWKAAGCPVHDLKKCELWLLSRQRIPAEVRKRVAERARKGRESRQPITPDPRCVIKQTAGMLACLSRLEREELKIYDAYLDAERSGDEVVAELRFKRWLNVGKRLADAHADFDAQRRLAGEVVDRTDVERGLRLIVGVLRMAWRQVAIQCSSRLMAITDEISYRQALRDLMATELAGVAGVYRNTLLKGVPRWLIDPLVAEWQNEYNLDGKIAEIMPRIAEAMGQSAILAVQRVIDEDASWREKLYAPPRPPQPKHDWELPPEAQAAIVKYQKRPLETPPAPAPAAS